MPPKCTPQPVVCNLCSKTYKNKKQLQKHRINVHKVRVGRPASIRCADSNCGQCFVTLNDYRRHLKSGHGLPMETETFQFNSRSEFDKWMLNEESKTNTHFVAARGERAFRESSQVIFVCNRSGSFTSISEGLRKPRAQGTRKIGFHCPASIVLKHYYESHLQVVYHRQHYGHDVSLCHVPLSKRHKAAIPLVKSCQKTGTAAWEVEAPDKKKNESAKCIVTKLHDCDKSCTLCCRVCKCCSDAYSCTCFDNVILNDMCVHMHAVAMVDDNKTAIAAEERTDDTDYCANERSPPCSPACEPTYSSKELAIEKYNSLHSKLLSISDEAVAEKVLNQLKSLEEILSPSVPLKTEVKGELFYTSRQHFKKPQMTPCKYEGHGDFVRETVLFVPVNGDHEYS